MSFWAQFKQSFRQFMSGRNGADALSSALLFLAILLTLIAAFTGSAFIHFLGLVAYAYCLFRMFSKNTFKRAQENQWYLKTFGNARIQWKQAWQRFKNVKEYKYVNCPQCGTLLRLPRRNAQGKRLGNITLTCSHCKHSFATKV